MKIPDPMIPLITIIVASNSVRRRAKVVVGPSLMDLGPPGKIRGEIRAVSISQDARARNRNRGYAPCIMPRLVQRLALALFFLCLAAGPAGPHRGGAPAVTAVRCGRLIDVETGKVLTGAVVLIQGDRIIAVGTRVTIPKGAKVIDL